MSYAENKRRAKTRNGGKPSKTDQAASSETDMNVIVRQINKYGQVNQTQHPGRIGDLTNFPQDLREAINQARSIKDLRRRLPEALQKREISELLTLSPDELTRILTPPAKPPAPPPGEQ